MDKPIRKFVLWKCRNLDLMRENLQRMRERKEEIIDESSTVSDGQPRAKYTTTDMVSAKVLRRENIDFSIKKIEYEIRTIESFSKALTGYEKRVYDETIARATNLNAKADLMGINRKKLIADRGLMLRQIATALGEYVDIDE